MISTGIILAALAASLPSSLAQEVSKCNPLTATCPVDVALSSSSFSSDFTTSSNLDGWSTSGGTVNFGNGGAQFTVTSSGDAPTIESDFYIFFGKLEVTMKAAPGTGIVSSIVLLSDVLDEVDWEFIGGNNGQVQTNYFSKGDTTTYDRFVWYPVSSPQTTSHTYTVDWTSETLTFAIDGTVVRTLTYAEANGGSSYPQTPMKIRIGNWAGGASSNSPGTIEWAGGATDFSQGPFSMFVESVKITNYSPGSGYRYKDNSGSYESIEVENGSGGVSGGSHGGSGSSSHSSSSSSSSSPAAASSSSSSSKPSTTAAGIRVEASTTKVASTVKGSTVTSGPQLTILPPIGGGSSPGSNSSSGASNATTTSQRTAATSVAPVSTNIAATVPQGAATGLMSLVLFLAAALTSLL